MAKGVDHSHGDAGAKPPQDLNFQDGDFPDPEVFDWFWSEVPAAINDHATKIEAKDQEWVEDIVNNLVSGSGKISVTYDDANNTLTLDTSTLTEEEVRDTAASFITGGQFVSVSHDDANNSLQITVADNWVDTDGDTMSGDLTMNATLDASNGRVILPVGTDLFSTQ